MWGKLNTFQKTILLWNEIHPYNAVHVVRIPRKLDIPRLTELINNHLEYNGLVNLVIDRGKMRFDYREGPSHVEIKFLETEKDIPASLHREVQLQLNIPFPVTAATNPFRFFAADDGNSFYLGVVYFHLIASADSIVSLMKNIVLSYMEGKKPENCLKLIPYRGTHLKLIPTTLKYLASWLFTLPENIASLRESYRPKYRDINNSEIGFSYFSIKPPEFRGLMNACKQWDVTVNDMFLALLLKTLSPLAPERFSAPRRKKISVASIVNIRKDLSVDNPAYFGTFLSSFMVSHLVPEDLSLEDLAQDIRCQTTKIKNNRLYLRTILEMQSALFLISSFFRKRKKTFYSKYYPLWGGITNVNLNTIWTQNENQIPIDYFRAVSTGHATPLVFSFTTVNDTMNIGVSFRETVFTRSDVESMISAFSRFISGLTGGRG
ncbi:hypothetical protein EP227_05400 [bacterium]|nr:MAG: hypothetical protein EP227_05400 [bacterium]